MSAALDIEALRAELAMHHQTLLSANDPIFIAVALNELVLTRYLQRIEELNTKAAQESQLALAAHLTAARTTVTEMVTRSAQYIADEVHRAVDADIARLDKAASAATDLKRGSGSDPWTVIATLIGTTVCVMAIVAFWQWAKAHG